MTRHFLNSYSLLLIKTCHKRGAHAMGGMAAQIPIKNDDDANKVALDKFIADKQREAQNGHDGTWVAHPGLVQKGIEIFNAVMPEPNQIEKQLDNITISEQDLLKVPEGQITEAGLRKNINVGLLYLKAWLSGNGCVPIYNLMEDAATAEISRTQLWQWRYHKASLNDGRTIDESLLLTFFNEEANKLKEQFGKEDVFLSDAIKLFEKLIMDSSLEEFLTTDAYELVIGYENS
jgi:malate synthase